MPHYHLRRLPVAVLATIITLALWYYNDSLTTGASILTLMSVIIFVAGWMFVMLPVVNQSDSDYVAMTPQENTLRTKEVA